MNFLRNSGVELVSSAVTATVVILAILFLPFPRRPAPAISAQALGNDTHYSIDSASYGKVVTVLRWHPQPDVSPARNQPLTFLGWAADDAAAHALPSSIEAIVDGGASYRAIAGLPRPDVAALYHNPVLVASGFRVSIPACALSTGSHRIEFRFEAANGSGFYRSRDDVDIGVTVPRPAVPQIRYALRAIAPGMAIPGPHTAIGWLVNEATCGPVAGMRVEVDGRVVAVARYGTPRPDVALAFGVPEYANAGFIAAWNDGALARGTHVLQLVAVLSNGRPVDSGYRLAFSR